MSLDWQLLTGFFAPVRDTFPDATAKWAFGCRLRTEASSEGYPDWPFVDFLRWLDARKRHTNTGRVAAHVGLTDM